MSTMVTPAYPPADADARAALLKWVRQTPLAYGPWRPFKALFKQLEADPNPDAEILGAILARLDTEPLHSGSESPRLKLRDMNQVQQAYLTGDTLTILGSPRSWGSADRVATFELAADNPLVANPVSSQKVSLSGQNTFVSEGQAFSVEYTTRTQWTLNRLVLDQNAPTGNAAITQPPGPIAVAIGHVFVATEHLSDAITPGRGGGGGVRVFSLAGTQPEKVADVALGNASRVQIAPQRKLLVVQTGSSGFRWGQLPSKGALHLLDVANPSQPREVGKIGATVNEWLLLDDLLLTTDGDTLTLHAVADPRNVREVGRWRYPEDKRSPYRGTNLLLAGAMGQSVFVGRQYETGLTQIDISNPRVPVAKAEYPVPQDTRLIGQRGDLFYTSQSYSGIGVWDVSRPESPTRLGARPNPETFGYLKRRSRRLLHRLGKTDPARYVAVAAALLRDADEPDLNRQYQWVGVDALYGGTNALVQMSHGRGSYVANRRLPHTLSIRRRDERFPEAWNAQPEQAIQLLNAPKAVSDAYALAIRILRATGKPVPTVTNTGVLKRMLGSDLPLLKVFGARGAVALAQQGKTLPANVAALAFLSANTAGRVILSQAISAANNNGKWNQEFADELLDYITDAWESADGNIKRLRRALPAIALLAQKFGDRVSMEQILPLVPALLLARRTDFTDLVVKSARATKLNSYILWLRALADVNLTPSDREPVIVALEDGVRGVTLPPFMVNLLTTDYNAELQTLTWRLLAASKFNVEQVAELWRQLLDRPQQTPSLVNAMASPYALQLLAQANLSADEIASRLQSRPFLAPLLSEETFGQLVRTAPAESLLALTLALDDTTFTRLRAAWLRQLREGVGVPQLWAALPEALKTDENGQIAARILGDAEIIASLVDLPDDGLETVLGIHEPLLDSLVTEWARRHEKLFAADSDPLTQAATSPLSAFRAWGLARVAEKGLRLPVALRLMESDLPDSLAQGRGFFEQVGGGDKDAFDYALALCDSPARAVRRYGRAFVTERWDGLPRTDLYTALFENSDPEMRQWMATLLGDEPAPDAGGIDTTPFDRDLLRSRDTARVAKEKVKARVARTGTVDTDTLLTLARGNGTPRDAEWALTQLARRALAGEKIEGFSVDGVAG